MRSRLPLLLALMVSSTLLPGPLSARSDATTSQVTIYRCTAGDGALTVRNSPCERGERQQVIEMQRPKDPPPRPKAMAPTPPSAPAPAPQTTRVIVVERPPPVYECTTADGDTYTSTSAAGNPRWVPLWTLGYPARPPYAYPRRPPDGVVQRPPLNLPVRPAGSPEHLGNALVFDGIGRPSPSPPGDPQRTPELPPAVGLAYTPGTWIHDDCQPLPPAEVCQRLRDRHWELGRRYNSALQSEREQIDAEQRRIDAQLDQQCAGCCPRPPRRRWC